MLKDASGDPDRAVSQAAFEALGRVLDHHLALVAPDFVSVVGTAAAFASYSVADEARSATALEALARLDACARALADGSIRAATRAASASAFFSAFTGSGGAGGGRVARVRRAGAGAGAGAAGPGPSLGLGSGGGLLKLKKGKGVFFSSPVEWNAGYLPDSVSYTHLRAHET